MNWFGKKLFAQITGGLSDLEAEEVAAAHELLSNGWPGHDNRMPRDEDRDRVLEIRQFITALASDDPKVQRQVLEKSKFKDIVAVETARKIKLSQLQYFAGTPNLSKRLAAQIFEADRKLYAADSLVSQTPEGEERRITLFGEIDDADMRLELAHLCQNVLQMASLHSHADPDRLNDATLAADILDRYRWQLGRLTEEEAGLRLDLLEKLANADIAIPERISGYMNIFRREGWKENLAKVVGEARAARIAKEESAERERVAHQQAERLAARKKIDAQISFTVEDGTLDVSMCGWPTLANLEDQIALFSNIKAAFAQATKVKLMYLPDYGQVIASRHIRSMSGRQFSLVKRQLWADRLGEVNDFVGILGLELAGAMLMINLLNADGRAEIYGRGSPYDNFRRESSETTGMMRADIDNEWFTYVDSFQKWISSDTLAGEWARWIVEEPDQSVGWADSR